LFLGVIPPIQALGGEIRTNILVEQIQGCAKRATAVRSASGEVIPVGQMVVSNIDPGHLVLDLLGVEMVGQEIVAKMKQYEWGDSVFVMFVALDSAINYKAGPAARQSRACSSDGTLARFPGTSLSPMSRRRTAVSADDRELE
jgi:phytoene dehydrogenase-like protein